MTYDLGGRRLTVDNELSHTTTFTYDNRNNVLSVEDELGNRTVNTYDAKGNLKKVTDANRETVGTAESGASCGTAATGNGIDNDSDGAIDDGCPSTIYNYDNADRLTSVIDALGNTTSYGYDGNGNRTSVTNAKRQAVGTAESGSNCGTAGTGNGIDNDSDSVIDDGCPSVLYTYDNLNRLATQKDGLGNTWSYAYDAASRLFRRTDPKGQVTTYGYNNRNDLTLIDYPAGTVDVSFQYDNARNRTQMVDSTGTTTYTPDALNRLSAVTFPGSRTVSYGYDNAGRRTSITYPGGSNQVTYGYDEANNLTSVTDWNSQQTTYAHNNANMLKTVTLPTSTGVVGSYSYDNADRLMGISWDKGSNTIASATYGLDNVGNRKQRVDQLGTHTYDYDPLHRLKNVTYPGPISDAYTYDPAGNRLTKNATTYAYDGADRMTSASGVTHAYDNNGNLTSRGSDTFSWDIEDRMTSTTIGGSVTTYTYNGDGLRNSRTFAGNTKTFTWDVATSIPQEIDDGTFKYVIGASRIARMGPGTTTHYFLPDGLGSTMAFVDASGVVAGTYDYDVFGGTRASTGVLPNEFMFTGEQSDAALRLGVDGVVSATNLTGATVANLDEDADGSDATWATATSVADTALRVGFPTPAEQPIAGSGLQEFRVQLRKNASGGNVPTYDLELWETGGAAPLATLATGVALSSDSPTTVSATWNASLLSTADGSKVELRIIGDRSGGSPSARRTVEVGAVEWNVATTSTSASGFYYLRARYYDLETGRFLSRDLMTSVPTWSGHAYSYAESNPANLTDPSGLDPDRPQPVPLPLPITASNRKICDDGWYECRWELGPKMMDLNRDLRDFQVSNICESMLRRCLSDANGITAPVKFEMGTAEKLMAEADKPGTFYPEQPNLLSNILQGIRRIVPPGTGTGGLVGSSGGSKEGGFAVPCIW